LHFLILFKTYKNYFLDENFLKKPWFILLKPKGKFTFGFFYQSNEPFLKLLDTSPFAS